jgi:hypothetical protein
MVESSNAQFAVLGGFPSARRYPLIPERSGFAEIVSDDFPTRHVARLVFFCALGSMRDAEPPVFAAFAFGEDRMLIPRGRRPKADLPQPTQPWNPGGEEARLSKSESNLLQSARE